tara:strand:+ start:285 stop:980 length:696 start_codon:yes stop_codon:yes gene_type:complete
MSSIKLTADSGGGTVELKAPATTGSNAAKQFILPQNDGSASQFMKTDGSGNLSFASETADFVKLASLSSSTQVSNLTFDSLDTTTYKYFKFVLNTLPEVDNAYINFRFRVSGSDQSSSNTYHWGNMGITTNTAALYDEANVADYGNVINNAGNQSDEGHRVVMDIVMKKSGEAAVSNYCAIQAFRRDSSGNGRFESSGICLISDVNPDGFKIFMHAGNIVSYNYCLYGAKR